MVIMGFPGIGKTSICKGGRGFIDLDSSTFKKITGFANDSSKTGAWGRTYVDLAFALSDQGNTVFVSSHETVQQQLKQRVELTKATCAVVYPDTTLRNFWLTRLLNRYMESGSDKDYNALVYMLRHYEESIDQLASIPQDGWIHIIIHNQDYNLLDVLRGFSIMRYGEGVMEG